MEKIYGIISEVLGIPRLELKITDNIKSDLGADSVDMVDILDKIENEFSIHVPDSEASNLMTIGDFCSYVNKLCQDG